MLMSSIIGHRGAAGYQRENTIRSFDEAEKLGVDWVELDATLLKDGSVILYHDETIKKEPIIEKTWDEIKAASKVIPLLSDVLAHCKKLDLGVNVELKTHGDEAVELAQAVSKIISDTSHGPLVVSSFSVEALKAFEGSAPKALLYDELPDHWEDDAIAVNAKAINLWEKKLTPDDVTAVKATKRDVYVFTVNEMDNALRLYGMGVDGVFSDYPDFMDI